MSGRSLLRFCFRKAELKLADESLKEELEAAGAALAQTRMQCHQCSLEANFELAVLVLHHELAIRSFICPLFILLLSIRLGFILLCSFQSFSPRDPDPGQH